MYECKMFVGYNIIFITDITLDVPDNVITEQLQHYVA